jgi:hypothetical protein
MNVLVVECIEKPLKRSWRGEEEANNFKKSSVSSLAALTALNFVSLRISSESAFMFTSSSTG